MDWYGTNNIHLNDKENDFDMLVRFQEYKDIK